MQTLKKYIYIIFMDTEIVLIPEENTIIRKKRLIKEKKKL